MGDNLNGQQQFPGRDNQAPLYPQGQLVNPKLAPSSDLGQSGMQNPPSQPGNPNQPGQTDHPNQSHSPDGKPPTPTYYKVLVGVAIFLGVVVLVGAGALVGMYFFGPGHAQADKAAEQKASQSEPRKEKSGTEEKSKTGQTQKPADTKPKIDPDAIKKIDFSNLTWKNDYAKQEIKFKNGQAVDGNSIKFEYDPKMTKYAYLNDDKYLDAYTFAVSTSSPEAGPAFSTMAVAWVWDPNSKTVVQVPLATRFVRLNQFTKDKAKKEVEKIIQVRDKHFYVSDDIFDNAPFHQLILVNGYPVCKETMTACLQTIRMPNLALVRDAAGFDFRSAPDSSAPVPLKVGEIDQLAPGDFDFETNGYVIRWVHYRGDPESDFHDIVWLRKK